MAITSEYTGGYEVTNILPKAVYNSQTIYTDSIQLIPEDRKSIFSLYFLEGYKTNIIMSYSLSSDNYNFSSYEEVINTSTIGNYIFFYTNTDINGFIKFKLDVTGSAEMEFNQLGVLKGVRTRSFILLEGANERRIYPCLENLAAKDPVKLINVSGIYKLAKLKGVCAGAETEIHNNGAAPQIEMFGNIVIMCYREVSNYYPMLKTGILNYDDTITWLAPVQIYNAVLPVVAGMSSISLKKLTNNKFVVYFITNNSNSYLIAGDIVNNVVTLGAVTPVGNVSIGVPNCSIVRLTDTKFILNSCNSGTNYPQYRCVVLGANNTFAIGANYTPNSNTSTFVTGALVDETNQLGPVFLIGVTLASGIIVYNNYISGTNTIVGGGAATIASSDCSTLEFALEAINTSKAVVSYNRDAATHKLAVQFLNIMSTAVTLGELVISPFDADKCACKLIPGGKIVHLYSYSPVSKLFYLISDLLTNGISWGVPAEMCSQTTTYMYTLRMVSAYRYLFVYCNEALHSIRAKIFNDDRGVFLGIMNENALANTNAEVKIISQVSNKFTGLTPPEQYYLQSDATISPAATGFSAGYAISETELLIKR